MVAHGRVELLAHPLSQKYLQMKWNSYGKYFHLANLLLYCIFLSFVTIFAAQLMDDSSKNTTEMNDDNSTYTGSHNVAKQEVLMHT
jgi:transient receptor potential cation channel subfamily A protein 1